MKTTVKLFGIGMLFFVQALLTPIAASEIKNDPRVQERNNTVSIWLLNTDRSDLTVKVYDRQNNFVRQVKLGNALTAGKILDFKKSDYGYYRLVIVANKEVIYNKKIRLGTK
ncbi:MAG: hypothetical protein AAGF96_21185 [Bacteroidota bacterium]